MKLFSTIFFSGAFIAGGAYKYKGTTQAQENREHSEINTTNSFDIKHLNDQLKLISFPQQQQLQEHVQALNQSNNILQMKMYQIYSTVSQNQFLKEAAILSVLGASSILIGMRMRANLRFSALMHSRQRVQSSLKNLDIEGLRNILYNSAEKVNLWENTANGKLVYANSFVSIQLTCNQPITDPFLGVEAVQKYAMGLKRCVDVYDSSTQKWISPKQFRDQKPKLYHPCMQEILFYPQSINLGQYELPSYFMEKLVQGIRQVKLYPKLIDKQFEYLSESFEEFGYRPRQVERGEEEITINQKNAQLIEEREKYQNHPFSYAFNHRKQVWYEREYIYIGESSEKLSDGDFRISFKEMESCLEASILAQVQGNQLAKFIFDSTKANNLKGEYRVGEEYKPILLKEIGEIKQGKLNILDFLSDYHQKLDIKNDYLVEGGKKVDYKQVKEIFTKLVALILLFCFYTIIVDKLKLHKPTWNLGLTGIHTSGFFLFVYGIINTPTFLTMITTSYLIAHLKSPIHNNDYVPEEQPEFYQQQPNFEMNRISDSDELLSTEERKFLDMISQNKNIRQ